MERSKRPYSLLQRRNFQKKLVFTETSRSVLQKRNGRFSFREGYHLKEGPVELGTRMDQEKDLRSNGQMGRKPKLCLRNAQSIRTGSKSLKSLSEISGFEKMDHYHS